MNTPDYFQVDVFASTSLNGNGLSVFPRAEQWDAERMQAITREMRQFESIFLMHADHDGAEARIFTVEEELPFAGHPLLGRRMPDLDLVTDTGDQRTYGLLHHALPVLLNLGVFRHSSFTVAVTARSNGPPMRPSISSVDSPL